MKKHHTLDPRRQVFIFVGSCNGVRKRRTDVPEELLGHQAVEGLFLAGA